MVRAVRWTLTWGLVVAAMLAATARTFGQTVKETPKGPAQKPGIYFESQEDGRTELVALDAAMTNVGANGHGGFGMFKKPKITSTIAGDRAARRLLTAEPSFVFVFGRLTPQQMMADASSGAGTSMMPPTATSPKDFALAILAPANGLRAIESGKTPLAKLTAEPIPSGGFRVKVAAPLAPGEYAFFFDPGSQGVAGMVWDFGVDLPAK